MIWMRTAAMTALVLLAVGNTSNAQSVCRYDGAPGCSVNSGGQNGGTRDFFTVRDTNGPSKPHASNNEVSKDNASNDNTSNNDTSDRRGWRSKGKRVDHWDQDRDWERDRSKRGRHAKGGFDRRKDHAKGHHKGGDSKDNASNDNGQGRQGPWPQGRLRPRQERRP